MDIAFNHCLPMKMEQTVHADFSMHCSRDIGRIAGDITFHNPIRADQIFDLQDRLPLMMPSTRISPILSIFPVITAPAPMILLEPGGVSVEVDLDFEVNIEHSFGVKNGVFPSIDSIYARFPGFLFLIVDVFEFWHGQIICVPLYYIAFQHFL